MKTNNDALSDKAADRDARLRQAGAVLRRLRKEDLGLTQEAFAKTLQLSRSVVGNAEIGRDISGTLRAALRERYVDSHPDEIKRIEDLCSSAGERSMTPEAAGEEDDDHDMFMRRSTNGRKIAGKWFALWEATANGETVLNTEAVTIRVGRLGLTIIENDAVSLDNPEGGYLWRAEGRLYDNQHYLGTYIPREPTVRSKGCLYLVLHPSGKYLNGQWIGCSYDGDWARGLVVFARDADRLDELLRRHRRQLPRLPYETSSTEMRKS